MEDRVKRFSEYVKESPLDLEDDDTETAGEILLEYKLLHDISYTTKSDILLESVMNFYTENEEEFSDVVCKEKLKNTLKTLINKELK